MVKLLPDGEFCGVKDIIGSHYEGISMIFRMLGAKIGKRVYWPGSGVPVTEVRNRAKLISTSNQYVQSDHSFSNRDGRVRTLDHIF